MHDRVEGPFGGRLGDARKIECAVGAWLKRQGWLLLDAASYSGQGPPHLEAANDDEELVVPDLLACQDGQAKWAEVKFKSSATWTTTTGRLETGLSLRLWTHYQRVQRASGLQVWIVFVYEREGEVRGATVSELLATQPRIYEGSKLGSDGMVFFSYFGMRLLALTRDVVPRSARAKVE